MGVSAYFGFGQNEKKPFGRTLIRPRFSAILSIILVFSQLKMVLKNAINEHGSYLNA